MRKRGAHRHPANRITLRMLFRHRTFSVLYLTEAQSILGDQLARVALAVLVFDRTGSTSATALTYAATFLPALFGGFFLGRIGDRVPRRWVLVGCDVVRAACFLVMTFASINLGVLIALLAATVALGPVFSAAQQSLLAQRLDGEEFSTANALRLVTSQAAQVAGFALGGVLAAAVEPRGALAVNAATFALSAIAVTLFVTPDTGAEPADSPVSAAVEDQADSFGGLWQHRPTRELLVLTLLIGFYVVPEGLAVPFGNSIDASTGQIGFLLASGALGGVVGAACMVRSRPDRRTRLASLMAIGCGLPLVLSGVVGAMTTNWWVPAACWLVSGALAAYFVQTSSLVARAIPDARRARLVGVVSALTLATQGIGVVVFGLVGQLITPSVAIAVAGGVGSLCALGVVVGSSGRVTLRARPTSQPI